MGRLKDITGQRFGNLTVIKYLRTDKTAHGHYAIWECKCDCGNITEVSTHSLKSGNTKSCGCLISKNLIGMRFGRLVVIDREPPKSKKSKGLWICKCDCGNITKVDTHRLKSGNTTSCGCKRTESTKKAMTKHGERQTRLYNVWLNMKQRCSNPKNTEYKNYGERGISVCDEWAQQFECFSKWAYSNGYDKDAAHGECTLDRIDNDGNYEPSNCRWVNLDTQSNNKRTNHILTYNGESHTLSEWSKIVDISYSCLKSRINKLNWSVEKSLTTPPKKNSLKFQKGK